MYILGLKKNSKESTFTEDELRTIMNVSHEEGVIEKEEREMINNVFDFGDAEAKDVMIPRIDMCMVDVNCSYDELMDIFDDIRNNFWLNPYIAFYCTSYARAVLMHFIARYPDEIVQYDNYFK